MYVEKYLPTTIFPLVREDAVLTVLLQEVPLRGSKLSRDTLPVPISFAAYNPKGSKRFPSENLCSI
jgi:hypothetical protein